MVADWPEEFSYAMADSPATQEIRCAAAVNRVNNNADDQQKRSKDEEGCLLPVPTPGHLLRKPRRN